MKNSDMPFIQGVNGLDSGLSEKVRSRVMFEIKINGNGLNW